MAFSKREVDALENAKILGVRSGTTHRYTGVWVVLVGRRVFARSWNNKESGWYRAFLDQRVGNIKVGSLEIPVRARRTRSALLQQAVSRAYATKYDTKGSQKWVRGFARPERESTTIEFVRA